MSVRHINPFRETAFRYRERHWAGTLPLPLGQKHPPPTGFTGRNKPYPTTEQVQEWCDDGKKHNICLRLAGISQEYEVIGIDVDHYPSGGKNKKGGDQLKVLEEKLGKLPDTWISSSRTDGVSGIRFYRVPRGFAFKGSIDDDIECIQKRHRFAVVWPSRHPEGGIYTWFSPGSSLTVQPENVEIPDALLLPELPKNWFDYLTQNGMIASDDRDMDMEASVSELGKWAEETFHGEANSEMCTTMRKAVNRHKKNIEKDATSHDKIVSAHHNILSLAYEGHVGWFSAIEEVDNFWANNVLSRGKRSLDELRAEAWRSRTSELRHQKAKSDANVNLGGEPVSKVCTSTGRCVIGGRDLSTVLAVVSSNGSGADSDGNDGGSGGDGGDPLSGIVYGQKQPVDAYEMNEYGNACHLVDKFSSSTAPAMRWADGYGFIVWKGGENPHWERDPDGTQLMNMMWQRIRKDQQDYIDNALQPDYEVQLAQWGGPNNGPMPVGVKTAKAKLEKWKKFVEINGNLKKTDSSIGWVPRIVGVRIGLDQLDSNPLLLGVANGVVELGNDSVHLREARPDDFITMNTNVPWEKPSSLALSHWQDYLDTFIPDTDLQLCVQIAMGHCLIGGNHEKKLIVLKGGTNTGKSTLIGGMKAALGDYAASTNLSIFQNHKLNPVLADSLNKRALFLSEFEREDKISSAVIKRLTGGSDTIRAELKGSNARIEGVPQFVPILAMNEVPEVTGPDKALRERLYAIPFDVTPKHIKKESSRIIETTCAPAILNWLIQGYLEYRRIGSIPVHQKIKNETDVFMAELDEITAFADECLMKQTNPQEFISTGEMYTNFKVWWNANGCQQRDLPSHIKFTRRLRALGWPYKQTRVNGKSDKFWVDVRLKKQAVNVYVLPNVGQSSSNR